MQIILFNKSPVTMKFCPKNYNSIKPQIEQMYKHQIYSC